MNNLNQINFIKSNLKEMLEARSVDQVVGGIKVLLNYIDNMCMPDHIMIKQLDTNCRNKINAIKAIRGALGLGLRESKDLIEQTHMPIYMGSDKDLAQRLHNDLVQAGANVQLLPCTAAAEVLFGDKQ